MCNCNGSNCRLCPNLVFSTAVTFADGTLTINIPEGSYNNREKYCLVITQAIPAATTITAPVVVTIGAGTEEYPLTNRAGAQLTATAIRTRTRYATVVSTTATGGAFRMLCNPRYGCPDNNVLTAINGTAPAAAAVEGGA